VNVYRAPERPAMCDGIDGVVFAVDAQSARMAAHRDAFEECEAAMSAYGQSVQTVLWVIQRTSAIVLQCFRLTNVKPSSTMNWCAF